MPERTCITPGCTQPFYALFRCHGCYLRQRAGRPPKPWEPHPQRERIVAPVGPGRADDLERIRDIAEAAASSPGIKPRERAVLTYALDVAAEVGSERLEIRRQHAARTLDITEKGVRSAIDRLVKLGWLEVVEPSGTGVSARMKIHAGQDETPRATCALSDCDGTLHAQGFCKPCYYREKKAGRVKNVLVMAHRLSDLDIENRTANCQTCGPVVMIKIVRRKNVDYVTGLCPAVSKANMRTRNAKKYGLTVEQHDAMLAKQHGRCAICRAAEALNIDHDHETGAVRDLLCIRCNFAVGQLRDSPTLAMKLARYLERHAQMKLPI